MSINSVTISGGITHEPDYRTTASGMGILRFSVAVNDRRKNQSGEWEDYPNYIDCSLIGKRADSLSKMLTKGMKVCVNGKLHYSSWQDKQTGQKRSKLEVTANDIEFMSRSQNGSQSQGNGYQGNGYQNGNRGGSVSAEEAYYGQQGMYDSDCPF